MLATISVEAIGWLLRGAPRNSHRPVPPRCGVFEFERTEGGHLRRSLRGHVDLSAANGAGSRGVFIWYTLESGRLYEVWAPETWKRSAHYYCCVAEDGRVLRFSTLAEAMAWWE